MEPQKTLYIVKRDIDYKPHCAIIVSSPDEIIGGHTYIMYGEASAWVKEEYFSFIYFPHAALNNDV